MTRPNKLEGLSLEKLSSQVLEFVGKARANPIGGPFRCFLLGQAPDVRLDWKVQSGTTTRAYLALLSATKEKSFIKLTPGSAAYGLKHII
jgi:hypothetical protein